jgi:signal transduction histidine kinase
MLLAPLSAPSRSHAYAYFGVLWVWSLSLLLPAYSSAQTALQRSLDASLPLPVRTYGPSDFRASGQTWAVVQDSVGRVFVGNSDGALVFDGSNWLPKVEMANRGVVRVLLKTQNGRIVAGGSGEIGVVETPADGPPSYRSLNHRIPDSLRMFGTVWSGTVQGDDVVFQTDTYGLIYHGRSDSVTVLRRANRTIDYFTVRDTVFLSNSADGQYVPHAYQQGGTMKPTDSPLGRLLIEVGADFSTSARGADYVLGRELLRVTRTSVDTLGAFPKRLLGYWPYAFRYVADGVLALATIERGVFLLSAQDGRLLRHLDAASGLPENTSQCLASDDAGGLWVCHDLGVSRVQLVAPARATIQHVPASASVTAVRGDTLIVGSVDRVAFVRAGRAGLEPIFDVPIPDARALHATPHGLLVGHADGVSIVRGDQVTRLPSPAGWERHTEVLLPLNADTSRVMAVLPGGACVLVYDAPRWTLGACLRIDDFTNAIGAARDAQGNVWIAASYQGVVRLRFDAAANALVLDERFGGAAMETIEVQPVLIGRQLYLAGDTLLRYDGRAFGPASDTLGRLLAPHLPFSISPTGARDRFAVYSSDGVRLLNAAALPPSLTQVRHDVFTSPDLLLLAQQAAGEVLAFGPSRVTRFDLELVSSVPLARAPRLSQVLHAGPDTSVSIAAPLHPRQRDLTLRFGSLSPELSGQMYYRTRLIGYETEWHQWSTSSERIFTNLGAGSYAFEMQARDPWGRETAARTASFRIAPHWYQTWWANLLLLAFTTGLLALLVSRAAQWRGRQMTERNAELEALVASRTAALEAQARDLADLNAQLAGTNEQLAQASRQKTALLGIAAHDLRNPIANIQSLAELLALDLPDAQDDARELVGLIRESAENMVHLIEDLLRSNEAERGEVRLDLGPVDLAEIAHAAVDASRARAGGKGQQIVLRADAAPVVADASRVRDVMLNLLSNAVKYSPRGASVRVEVASLGAAIRFSVADEGPGLTDADRLHLFEPFQRLSARPTEGESSTGLGLYIVRQYVEAMGGRVGVDSKPGSGSTFWFELPRQDPERDREVVLDAGEQRR